MEQTWMSRDRATYLWALSLWQKSELSHLGARCEQVLFHKRLYPKSRSTHEKLLKLISHYGSSNLKLPTPVLLPGKSHGWRSLMGCSPWDSRTVGHDSETSLSLFTFLHWRRKWQPTPVFLPGESLGQGSLVGCHLWGRTESDTTEAT